MCDGVEVVLESPKAVVRLLKETKDCETLCELEEAFLEGEEELSRSRLMLWVSCL